MAGQLEEGRNNGGSTANENEPVQERRHADPAAFGSDDPRVVEAYRRERILLFAESQPGGWPARTDAVETAIAEGDLKGEGPAPSRSTLYRWAKRYEAGGRDYAALIDLPSTGRKADPLDPWIERYLRRLLRARPNLGPTALYRKAVAFAEHSARVQTPPRNVYQIRRWRNAIPIDEITSSQYGTRRTRACAQPKRTYPTDMPNELWQVDEVNLPVWLRVWDAANCTWLIAVAWAVFVRDHYSRAILGWWVKEPTVGNRFHTQFTAEEVLGTIAGAAVPEFAHPVVQELVIGDPEKVMMDGSGSMGSARKTLKEMNLVDVGASEPYSPWQNGGIENFFRTLKKRDLPDLVGSKLEWVVFDHTVDPRTLRDTSNADLAKAVPKLREIPILSLPRPVHLRSAIAHFVAEHNQTPTRGLRGDTPISRFLRDSEFVTDRPSRLVETFPEHRVQLEQRGVEIRDRWYQSDQLHHLFPLKTKLVIRRDPLERGVFVFPANFAARARGTRLFVANHREWAKAADPGEIAEALRRESRELREKIDADRERYTTEVIGEDAAAELAEAIDTREKELAKKSRKAKRIEKARQEKAQRDLFAALEGKGESEEKEASGEPAPVPERQEATETPTEQTARSPEPRKVIPFVQRRRPKRGVRLIDNSLLNSK